MRFLRPAFLAALLFNASLEARAEIKLSFPVACELGTNCWIQQLPDHDPSKESTDYTCGSATYDGHDGTDIRLRDTTSKANVLAAADGVVKAGRDGMADQLIREGNLKSVANRECGNGVVITHADGYETQYCHMKKGSIAVKQGKKVKAGDRLGLVGFSGAAAFPHLHLTLRKDGEKIDPFSGALSNDCLSTDQSLWNKDIAYEDTSIIGMGFAPKPFQLSELETGKMKSVEPNEAWANFVGYVWAINLKKDDEVTLSFKTPKGAPAVNKVSLERSKAQYFLIAGKKKPAGGWANGTYELTLEIQNQGTTRLTRTARFELK